MPALPDPSEPLANARHEIYAAARAKGLKQSDSWRATIPFGTAYKGGDLSLRVSGNRVESRPEVRARIDFLTMQGRVSAPESVPDTLTRADIIQASLEVSEALEDCYRRAVESACSPQQIERLKSVWAAHLARQGKLDEAHEPLPTGEETDVAEIMARVQNLGVCSCHQTR